MTKRTFESGDKFWEVWLDGDKVYTRHGKAGTSGQTKLKPGDAATMQAMIAAKQKEGYIEPNAKVPELDAKAKEDLSRHLKNLTDDGAYLVLADWLQKHEHPWGELIALSHARDNAADGKRGKLDKALAQHLAAHAGEILGDVARHAGSSFTWKRGFVDVATLGTDATGKAIVAAVKSFVKLPIARDVRGVVVNPVPASFATRRSWAGDTSDAVDPWPDLGELAKAIPDHVDHVGFGGWPAPAATALVVMPTYTAIGKAFPKLRKLELTGAPNGKPGKLALAQLEELEVRFSVADADALASLAQAKLPKLTALNVWLGGSSNCILDDVYAPNYDADEDAGESRYPDRYTAEDLEKLSSWDCSSEVDGAALRTLLSAVPKTVTHLGIRSGCWDEEMLGAVVGHKLIKQLHTLDLSGGDLGDDDVKPLIAAKKQLAHLAAIDLTRNHMTKPDKLGKALPNARVDDQRKVGRPELMYRYVAVME